jgi:hypothetical protein
LSLASCTKDLSIDANNSNFSTNNGLALGADESGRSCEAMSVLSENMRLNPGLAQKMNEIEKHTASFMRGKAGAKAGATPQDLALAAALTNDQVIEIPVVVNVIYNTAQENISDAQIASQIDVMNKDFSATNADVSKLLQTVFTGQQSSFNIHFTLVATNRKQSSKTSWGTRDAMKSSKKGGIDPTDPTTKLNIWVCNIGGGILGYAQFPGGSAATDGVVIGPNYFGSSDYASNFYLSSPYDKGRTATHEVGHWVNLRHIWGDATCGSDQVADTPVHNTANYNCPALGHKSTCTGTPVEMTMNYMDYTADACMYMFSAGQRDRARAIFATGGARASFVP